MFSPILWTAEEKKKKKADSVTRADGAPVAGRSVMMRETHDSASQESVSLFVFLSLQKDG